MFGFAMMTGAGAAEIGVAQPGAAHEVLISGLAPFAWIGLALVLVGVLALIFDRDRPAQERSTSAETVPEGYDVGESIAA
jgi:hypothetical protein